MNTEGMTLAQLVGYRGAFCAISPAGEVGPTRRRLGTAMRDCVYGHKGWGKPRDGVRVTLPTDAAAIFFPEAVAAGWVLRQVKR